MIGQHGGAAIIGGAVVPPANPDPIAIVPVLVAKGMWRWQRHFHALENRLHRFKYGHFRGVLFGFIFGFAGRQNHRFQFQTVIGR